VQQTGTPAKANRWPRGTLDAGHGHRVASSAAQCACSRACQI